MTMYQAIILCNDMARSNKDNISFNTSNWNYIDNLCGDCLRSQKIDKIAGFQAVMDKWNGFSIFTKAHIEIVWIMAGMLLSNRRIEMD